MLKTTICFLIKDDSVLLAMKKRGFGMGKWNGIGGKREGEETIAQNAVRELKEEIGVNVAEHELEPAGELKFYFNNKSDWNNHCHIFRVKSWSGEPEESEEMAPKWYSRNDLPFSEMWIDDIHWLPLVLSGKNIEAEF